MHKIALLAFATSTLGCGAVANEQDHDAGTDTPPEVDAPRPVYAHLLGPLSTTTVRTNTPTLRWKNPLPDATAEVQVCADRACTRVIKDSSVAAESLATALDPGAYFWRVKWNDVQSATWEFFVPTTPHGSVDTAWGTTLDLNGDGFAEVVLRTAGGLEVHLGSASGTASASATIPLPPSPIGTPALLTSGGDLDGNGFPELVVRGTTLSGAAAALIYFGSASGIGATPTTIPSPDISIEADAGTESWFPNAVLPTGDIDADGYGDLILTLAGSGAGGGAGKSYVYKGSKDGIATAPSITLESADSSGSFGFSANAIDIDGDGQLELFISESTPEAVSVFKLPSTKPFVQMSGIGFVADFNCDGYGDYYVTPPEKLEIHPGSRSGFGPTQTLSLPLGLHWATVMAVGDFNGDGCDDALVSDDVTSMISVWTGDPSAWLIPGSPLGIKQKFSEDTTPSVVSVGDTNGDGRLDAAIRIDSANFEGHLGDGATGLSTSAAFSYPANCVASSDTP
jgi:hypothetical protein